MVARLIEGFESSTVPADYQGKWIVYSNPVINAGNGRFGIGCHFGSTHGMERLFPAHATVIVGLAFRVQTMSGDLLRVRDASVVQCGVSVESDGSLLIYRSTSSTVLGRTASGVLTPNVWRYLEFKFTINDTTGVAVLRMDGVTLLNLTGIDTKQTANATANSVLFGASSTGGMVAEVDDIYIFDGSGTVNNDFAGDCRVAQVLPTGAGATTAWTPSAGANWDCVNEVPPNGDTDYVSSATAGQTDTYAFSDLAVTGSVKAVQATVVARKDDAGSRSLALVARPGSTDRVGATAMASDGYTSITQVWDTNPDTAADWTVAEVNASQFGVRLVA